MTDNDNLDSIIPHYTLEYLSKVFSEHFVENEKERQRILKKFKEDNPEQPVPEWLNNDFSFPLAIKTIVDELLKMKPKDYVQEISYDP